MPALPEDRLFDKENFPLGKDNVEAIDDDGRIAVSGLPQVKIAGSMFTKEILSVVLEQSIDGHHVLEVLLLGDSDAIMRGEGGVSDGDFNSMIGSTITLSIATADTGVPREDDTKLEFIGDITRVRFENEVGGLARAAIIAHSPTLRMDGNPQFTVFRDATAADVIKRTVSDHGIPAGSIESFGPSHEYVLQHNQTDFAFIMSRANSQGMFAFYDSKKFHVVKNPKVNEIALTWGENLGDFRIGFGVQANSVTVRGWDYKSKQAVVGESSSDKLPKKSSDLAKKAVDSSKNLFGKDPYVIQYANGSEKAIVDAQAAAEAGERVSRTVTGRGESASASMTCGSHVQISKTGKFTDGKYLVTRVVHRISKGAYSNQFDCMLLSSAYPSQKYRRLESPPPFTAVVTDIEDPDALGRVKVKSPWSDKDECFWARVASPGSGPERGTLFLPEVNDEVLVIFDRGNPEVPIVIGALWNGKDKTPLPPSEMVKDGKVQKRVIKSRTGLTVLLDDTQGEESVQIVLVDGKTMVDLRGGRKPVITVNSEAGVKIVARESIELDAMKDISLTAKGNIKLDAKGDVEMKAGGNATLEATTNLELAGMQVKLAGQMKTEITGGAQLEVKGSGQVAIKGAMVMIN